MDAAYAAATQEWTDDAAVYAANGGTVRVVDGETRAFKITVPWDLRRAESILGATANIRTGVGMDVHAFDESAPLWLGGLYWPDEPGLAGHSDGDALAHAICDALLSAAGLGDIGSRFGTSDPRFAGAHADVFLGETVALVKGAGYAVGNVSVQLVANRPRIGERRMELEAHLSGLVGAPVSVSATTTDGLGALGEGKGVFAMASALVMKIALESRQRAGTLEGVTVRLYDSRAQAVVDLQTLEPDRVGVYVCGPTVQSSPHIGHLRSALVYDLWRRWLTHSGYDVTLVRNVTDIDDKILNAAADPPATPNGGGRSPTAWSSSSLRATTPSASCLRRTNRARPRTSRRCATSSSG